MSAPTTARRWPGRAASASPDPSGGRGAAWESGPRFVAWVLGAYALARGVSALLLIFLTRYQVPVGWTGPRVEYLTIVGLWDAGWYRQIAEEGYPATLPVDAGGQLQQNPWAFYPLFPYASRALMQLTGWPFATAGSTLALLFGAAAAVLIAWQLRELVGARVAMAAVIVWATCAPSPVLQVAYSESVAILVLAAVLWALQREAWWAAAALAALTGLARPIAVPLGVVALVAVIVRWRARHDRPVRRGEAGGMLAALLACGVAGLMWPTVAWLSTGIPTAYTDTMATWRAGAHIVPLTPWVGIARYLFGIPGGALALVAAIALLVGLVAGPWAARLGPVLRAWCLAYPAYLALVLDPGTSLFRYLLPLYPWAVLAVDGAWRARRGAGGTAPPAGVGAEEGAAPTLRRVASLTALWVLLGTATQWWWLYELWRFIPPSDWPP